MTKPRFASWDVVKVPFPFTEGIGDKKRPALVISGPALVTRHKLYWLLMITSVIRPAWQGDVMIENLDHAGLPVPSVVRTAKITTLQEDRLLGRIGSLDMKERKRVKTDLKDWLAG
jgi:mRNA interferase MazF